MSSASLPPRQSSSQRRSSPEQQGSAAQSSPSSSPSLARTNEAEPVVLQQPHDSKDASEDTQEHEQKGEEDAADGENLSNDPPGQGLFRTNTAEDEPKKCWICFADATEDTPETSPWRDPCPCALIAHEECLLDWIADMEAPNRARNRPNGGRIECPQCKSEIKLERPRSFLVDAIRNMENMSARLVTPGALTVLFGTLYQSSVAWGIHSIYAVFGAQEGFELLKPLLVSRVQPHIGAVLDNTTARDLTKAMLETILHNLVHWRLYVGVPLITPILILSRTHFGDTLLPTLPIVFFATQTHTSSDLVQVGRWPPSAPFAFAMLPYVRAVYNYYHHILAGRHEQRWLREIQPRAGHEEEGEGENANAAERPAMEGGDENMFEIRIDGWEEWDDEDQDALIEEVERVEREVQQEEQRQQQQPEGQNDNNAQQDPLEVVADMQLDGAAQAAPPNAQQAPPDAANAPAAPAPAAAAAGAGAANDDNAGDDEVIARERRLSFSPTAIAETVIGAILFPSIAGFSGDLLKFVLPRAWTSSPATSAAVRKGLLQERWGRTIVGGCLFVVLKDAVMLYVRWKMAQMHRKRRVLDFDRSKETKRGAVR